MTLTIAQSSRAWELYRYNMKAVYYVPIDAVADAVFPPQTFFAKKYV